MNRKNFLEKLDIVKPCIKNDSILPIFGNIHIDNSCVESFNGVQGIKVDLEESLDNNMFLPFLESLSARKTGMPLYPASTGRTITCNLRSDNWRNGVKKETDKYLEEGFEKIKNLIGIK